MHEILKITIDSLRALPKELIIVIISALPVFELRLGLPVAIFAFKFSYSKAIIYSLVGNILPIAPVLFLLEPVTAYLNRFKPFNKFFNWFVMRTKKNAEIVQRLEAIGLMLFVAIPLPATGIWTGCLAASIFKIRFRYAFLACAGGALIAAMIVAILCFTGKVVIQI